MKLLSSSEAALQLGIERATLYDWLSQSDAGTFAIRGQLTSISYYQGGRNGQGRIKIEATEVQRLLQMMKAAPNLKRQRKSIQKPQELQHITTKLGRPDG